MSANPHLISSHLAFSGMIQSIPVRNRRPTTQWQPLLFNGLQAPVLTCIVLYFRLWYRFWQRWCAGEGGARVSINSPPKMRGLELCRNCRQSNRQADQTTDHHNTTPTDKMEDQKKFEQLSGEFEVVQQCE